MNRSIEGGEGEIARRKGEDVRGEGVGEDKGEEEEEEN